MPLVAARCPSCGATIKLPNETDKSFCTYCGVQVITQAAIEYGKVEIAGQVEVKGVATAKKLAQNGDTFLKLGEYEKARSAFEMLIKDFPEDYHGWWGMTRFYTRDLIGYFSIVAKYYFDRAITVASPIERETITEQLHEAEDIHREKIERLANVEWHDQFDRMLDDINGLFIAYGQVSSLHYRVFCKDGKLSICRALNDHDSGLASELDADGVPQRERHDSVCIAYISDDLCEISVLPAHYSYHYTDHETPDEQKEAYEGCVEHFNNGETPAIFKLSTEKADPANRKPPRVAGAGYRAAQEAENAKRIGCGCVIPGILGIISIALFAAGGSNAFWGFVVGFAAIAGWITCNVMDSM